MTEAEAKHILEHDSCYECSYGVLEGATNCRNTQCNVARATNLAINALEKQIAKKLRHGVCPNCGTNNDKIIKHLGNPQAHNSVYCWNCGQKLDWSEV